MKEIKNDKDIKQIANEIVKAYGKIRKTRTRDNNNSGGN